MRLQTDSATTSLSLRISSTRNASAITLQAALPHRPTSPNAYAPTDIALGCGADQLSRVAWRAGGPSEARPVCAARVKGL